jgi:hypothetical protein
MNVSFEEDTEEMEMKLEKFDENMYWLINFKKSYKVSDTVNNLIYKQEIIRVKGE